MINKSAVTDLMIRLCDTYFVFCFVTSRGAKRRALSKIRYSGVLGTVDLNSGVSSGTAGQKVKSALCSNFQPSKIQCQSNCQRARICSKCLPQKSCMIMIGEIMISPNWSDQRPITNVN